MCGHASVARSTMGRRLLPSGPSHKTLLMFFSNMHSARVGAGAAVGTFRHGDAEFTNESNHHHIEV